MSTPRPGGFARLIRLANRDFPKRSQRPRLFALARAAARIMRLLLVEDDTMIGTAAQQGLRLEGYVVDWVRDGRQAELAIVNGVYDLVLLDLGLPRRDGLSVLRGLRDKGSDIPVVIITARDAIDARGAGLDR